MLRFLSKRKRSRKALLWVFVAVLAAGLIGVFTPWSGLQGSASDDTVVAEVGDHEITLREYRTGLAAFGRQMAMGQGTTNMADAATLHALYGQTVLDGLVRSRIVMQEADDLDLDATDQEVQDRLKQLFNPWPGAEAYRRQLQGAGTTPVQFEKDLRTLIAEEKLKSYITAAVLVTPQEIEEEYRRNNTTYTVRWADVRPEELQSKVQLTDADLRAYYDQNKEEFRVPTEQRRASYIFIDQSKTGTTLQVSDDELRQNFNPERGVQEVRVSQIVLSAPRVRTAASDNSNTAPKTTEVSEEARKKALDIANRAQAAEGKAPEDFAELARTFSEDAKSKAAGGDIGWVKRGDKREADDPLNSVFNMQQGDVSQPILKRDKFYIFKVTGRKLPTFEEAREQLLKEAQATRGYSRAVEIAAEAEQRLKETKNPDAVASEINNKHGQGIASVRQTRFFVQTETLPELGNANDFQTKLFELQNTGDVAERLNVTGGLAVAQLAEKREPNVPPFEDVRAAVEEKYREVKSKDLAAERARQLAAARTPDALNAAAAAMGIRVEERASLSGNDSIGSLVTESARERIYKLNPNEVVSEPIKAEPGDSYVVAALISRKDADMGQPFEQERKSIEERLLEAKRASFFAAYIASKQKTMKDKGEVEIYQDVLDTAIASGAGTDPMRGMPRGNPPAPTRTAPRRTPQGAVPSQPTAPPPAGTQP